MDHAPTSYCIDVEPVKWDFESYAAAAVNHSSSPRAVEIITSTVVAQKCIRSANYDRIKQPALISGTCPD